MQKALDEVDAAAVIERMRAAYGVDTIAGLAARLAESSSTVSSWKQRASVPLSALIQCIRDNGGTVDDLLWGPAPTSQNASDTADQTTDDVKLNGPSAHLAGERAAGYDPVNLDGPHSGGQGVGRDDPHAVSGTTSPGNSVVVRTGGIAALPPRFEPVTRARDYVVLPNIEAPAKAGRGAALKEEQERIAASVAGVLALDRAWMTNQLGRGDGGFATIAVSGDSMSPTLRDGDTIIVDTYVDRIETDGIYVLRRGAVLIVKRVLVRMDGSGVIRGDNADYGAEELQPATVRELRVVGKMVWPRLR